MRKVKFSVYSVGDRSWVDHPLGYFHCWGQAYDEFESGPGNNTMAFVESPTGQMFMVHPEKITFLDPYKPAK